MERLKDKQMYVNTVKELLGRRKYPERALQTIRKGKLKYNGKFNGKNNTFY